jgi:hypothetical protein
MAMVPTRGRGVFRPSRPRGGVQIRRKTAPAVIRGRILPGPQGANWTKRGRAVGEGDGDAASGALSLGVRQGQAQAAFAGLEVLDVDGGELGAAERAGEACYRWGNIEHRRLGVAAVRQIVRRRTPRRARRARKGAAS